MSKVALVVEFDVKADSREAFEELMRSHASRTLAAEDGCLNFEVLIPKKDQGKIFLFECYADEGALQTHMESPILADTRSKYEDMVEDRRITLCTVAS